jgi:hypothetical protein
VVFALTFTTVDPSTETVPTPLLILTDVASLVFQESVEVPALASDDGDAVNASQVGPEEVGPDEIVIARVQVTVPPTPVAVSVYVVFAVMFTTADPSTATLPTPLFIDTDVAPVVLHERVDGPALLIEEGEAVNASHVGALGGVTVGTILTVATHVADCVPFIAVSVYVVLVSTLTLVEPSTATTPMLLLRKTVVAPVVFHESVAVPALLIDEGVAVNESQVGPPGVTTGVMVTVRVQVTVPPAPVAVSVYVVLVSTFTFVDPSTGTLPTPLLIEVTVAPVVFHERVTIPALVSEVGDAVKASQVGALGVTTVVTVTARVQVTVPPAPVAVSVYVVFALIFALAEPSTATLPTPLLIETEVAPVVLHERVTIPEPIMVEGVAVNASQVGAADVVTGVTTTVLTHCTEPPAPVAVIIIVLVIVGLTIAVPLRGNAPMPRLATKVSAFDVDHV